MVVLAALLTLVGTAALRLDSSPSSAAVSSTLHATVGPAFEISLTFDDGSPVGALPAGSYRILVSDLTSDHNFHLFGPGVNQDSGVDSTGTATWNVTFGAGGRYQFVCDVHADSMFGSFNAGAADSAPQSGGGSGGGGSGGSGGGSSGTTGGGVSAGVAATRGMLTAALAATGKPSLSSRGKAVKALASGRYTFVVTDSSRKEGVTIRRTGAAATALTGAAFSGRASRTVTLAAGQWKLYPSGHPAGGITFRVT
jgi:hypothetical protein